MKAVTAETDDFTITMNEVLTAKNLGDDYRLALVEVSPDGPAHDTVRYLRQPYGPDLRLPFDTTATTLGWNAYWHRAESPT